MISMLLKRSDFNLDLQCLVISQLYFHFHSIYEKTLTSSLRAVVVKLLQTQIEADGITNQFIGINMQWYASLWRWNVLSLISEWSSAKECGLEYPNRIEHHITERAGASGVYLHGLQMELISKQRLSFVKFNWLGANSNHRCLAFSWSLLWSSISIWSSLCGGGCKLSTWNRVKEKQS